MKNLCTLLLIIITVFVTQNFLNAQSFTPLNTNLEGVAYGTSDWGDIDNDGDLDLVISGKKSDESGFAMLYINNEGMLEAEDIGLPQVFNGEVAFGDYDNDDDLDLLITGVSATGVISVIYENQGSYNFLDIEAGLTGVENGKSAWGDYDNDGDLDLVISGNWQAIIYRNDDGTFTDSGNDFGYINSSCVDWGDYDHDGDLDLLLTGDTGGGILSRIFRNDDGQFVDSEAGLYGLMAGVSGFVDYDNDSDPDVYVSGYDNSLTPLMLIYDNDGEGRYTENTMNLPGTAVNGLDWGDFDFDGDLDFVVSGKGAGCGLYVADVYLNENGTFNDVGGAITPYTRAYASCADYDNDGDLDIVMSGLRNDAIPTTTLYQNDASTNEYVVNTPPDIPTGLETSLDGNQVELSWDGSFDAQTFAISLNYNIYMGTIDNPSAIVSPMANPENGLRKISGIGNAFQNNTRKLKNLPAGTYYWKVQAIDQCFSGSGFSEEQSFTVLPTGIDQVGNGKMQIVFDPELRTLEISGEGSTNLIVSVFDIYGKEVASSNSTKILLNGIPNGVYIVSVKTGHQSLSEKFFIN